MPTRRLPSRQRGLDASFEAALAGGREPDSERGAMIMSLVQTVRASLDRPPPEPSGEFAVLLEDGPAPNEISSTAEGVPPPPTRVAEPSRPRGRTMLGAALARVVALGLFAKFVLGGAAVALAATGAGAAGVLPGPAQDAFDRVSAIVTGEPPRHDVAPEDAGTTDRGGSVRVEPDDRPVAPDVGGPDDRNDPPDRRGDRGPGEDISGTDARHRQEDSARSDAMPDGTDTDPSGDQHREQTAPADPPPDAPHAPDDPVTIVPDGAQTPTPQG